MSSVSTLIIFLILIQACSTKKETSKNTANESQTVTKTENDTIPEPPPPPVSELGAGQAKVGGLIVSFKEHLLYLRVESIHEYGSATPPIATNDTLSIQVGSNTRFEKESKTVLIIQHNISSDSSKSPAWSFVKLAN